MGDSSTTTRRPTRELLSALRNILRRPMHLIFQTGAGEASWERFPRWYINLRLSRLLGDRDAGPRRAIREEIARIGGDILEVACGPGIEYEGIRRAGLNVTYTGVDVTPKMVELARRRFPEARFLLADVQQLPFSDGSFDLVFAKDLFEHLTGFEPGITEMYRVARRAVVVHFFRPLVDGPTDYRIDSGSGFRDNRYSRQEVLAFAGRLGAGAYDIMTVESKSSGHLLRITKA